jgi:hypothetical protein
VTEPLLAGKLHVPSRRSPVVARSRLAERLGRADGARLTLVSAPPGFGKSTLLAERAAANPNRRTAWLSLDAGDNDLGAFWRHVIAALQAAAPGIGVEAQALIEPAEHPIRTGITALLNDLVDLPTDVDLVLDDYLRRGRFAHHRIGAATPIAGERVVGWVAHYAIGVAFAVPLLVIWGPGWVASPTIGPALVVGLVTILAPWLIMQPAMGAGIAAARTPHPWAARLRNVVTHAVYGVGLYLSAAAVGVIWP